MLADYLGEPTYLIGVGNIFPIKIEDIERFRELASNCLIIGRETINNRLKIEVEYLMDFYISNNENFFDDFKELLELSLRENIEIIIKTYDNGENDLGFRVKDTSFEVNKYNFEKFREVCMEKNLLHEPRTEKNDLLQEWLELARETKMRSAEEVDIESICQLLSVYKGINPIELKDYTYYQLMAEYSRISVIDAQQYIMLLRSQGVNEKLPTTSKKLDLYKNPDDDLVKIEKESPNGKSL